MQLRSMPVAVLSARAYAQVFAGGTTSCAITMNDELLCWGKLHDETAFGGMARATMPVPIDGGHAWKSVDLDDALHACALTTDGTAHCWGANHQGMLGNATTDERMGLVPVTPPG
jgi:alpha-tubulin suppressor-like RCC1 family protein